MSNNENKSLIKYQISAAVGTVIMGIACYFACFGASTAMRTAGNISLLVSIAIMIYGFSHWQP